MAGSPQELEAVVITETRAGKFQVEITAGPTTIVADEPVAVGGLGSGPNPYDLLGAALGSCTVMTLRLYADQKKWPLTRTQVKVSHVRGSLQARDVFNREIHLEGPLDEAQRARLMEIAQRCPVHVTLQRGSDITTTLMTGESTANEAGASGTAHMQTMQEAGAV